MATFNPNRAGASITTPRARTTAAVPGTNVTKNINPARKTGTTTTNPTTGQLWPR